MKDAARLFVYAALWACMFGFALVLVLVPKLIGDSGSLGTLLTQPVPRHWLLNTVVYAVTGRHLALYALFGLLFGVLHLLICAGLGEWKAFKLPAQCRNLMAGAILGVPLGGVYLLYATCSPFLNGWCGLLIVLVFLGCGGVSGLWGGDAPRLRPQADSL